MSVVEARRGCLFLTPTAERPWGSAPRGGTPRPFGRGRGRDEGTEPMDLRVTLQTFVSHALAETRAQTDRLAQLQTQASTGQLLTAPSDDPALASLLQAGNAQSSRLQSYLDNINAVRNTLNHSV